MYLFQRYHKSDKLKFPVKSIVNLNQVLEMPAHFLVSELSGRRDCILFKFFDFTWLCHALNMYLFQTPIYLCTLRVDNLFWEVDI